MSEAANLEYIPLGCDLLGQVEYYGAILGKKDLITREGEFRISKLGLIVDLIKVIDVPYDMISKLTTAIIEAWRLDAPERSLAERAEEMSYIMRSIEAIRSTIQWCKRHQEPDTARRMDIAVLFALPLMPSDLCSSEVGRVHELLGQIVNYLSKTNDRDMKLDG
jgi:hypothetical protein